jgi:hypothetical protein
MGLALGATLGVIWGAMAGLCQWLALRGALRHEPSGRLSGGGRWISASAAGMALTGALVAEVPWILVGGRGNPSAIAALMNLGIVGILVAAVAGALGGGLAGWLQQPILTRTSQGSASSRSVTPVIFASTAADPIAGRAASARPTAKPTWPFWTALGGALAPVGSGALSLGLDFAFRTVNLSPQALSMHANGALIALILGIGGAIYALVTGRQLLAVVRTRGKPF